MRLLVTLSLVAGALAAACSPPPRYARAPAGETAVLAVWIDPKSPMPAGPTLAGCNMWNPKGIRCVHARNPVESDVAVVSDYEACQKDADGKVTHMTSFTDRVIQVRIDCFTDDRGRQDRFYAPVYEMLIAHEFGHELGIWEHVEEECDDGAPVAPDGTRACGPAVMNATPNPDLHYLTPADSAAFDLRNRDEDAFPPRVSEP